MGAKDEQMRWRCSPRISNYLLSLLVIVMMSSVAVAYDPLDPTGNITIKWDLISWTADGYVAVVTMNNFQMYRHIMSPGWTLGWTWAKKEVIWSMVGAQATEQGDCSKFKGGSPHCCKRTPTIVDLLPGVPYNQQIANCCKGGVVASYGQDPAAAVSSFQVSVGLSGTSNKTVKLPQNFTLLGPGLGYTCGPAKVVPSTTFFTPDRRRKTQAPMTWNVTCTYSQFLASKHPSCCVSFSSFYNDTIIPCSSCACGCETKNCIKSKSNQLNSPGINTPKIAPQALPLVAMALTSSPLAPTSAYFPSPRSLCLPRPQLPSPLSSRRFKETGVAAPLEFSSAAWPRWRTGISFFPSFIKKKARSREEIKEELLAEIASVDRGAEATDEDKQRIDQIARELEAVNTIKEPSKSDLLNGKWELIYTTSRSTLKVQRPKFLRPNGKIYQAINVDTLRAQNMETWPYFNQVTANLIPLNARRVKAQFDTFKILGLIPIKAPGRNRGELEITYLDEDIRISRGYKGNIFILKMVDRSYRVPL